MKRLLTCAASCMAAVMVLAAQSGIGTCSWFIFYEPDIPESLKQ